MKRKDVDEVSDGIFDFTLSSPALKIRRLDAEMVPMIDEQVSVKPMAFGESTPLQDAFVEQSLESSPIAMDELSCSAPGNEERAIVLFNPQNNPPSLHSPRSLSLSVDSDFLSALKNPVIWSNRSNAPKSLAGETQKQDDNSEISNGCLAVVPWALPSHFQHPPNPDVETPSAHISEMMDTDAMDIEENYNIQQMPKFHRVTSLTKGLNQWQQRCMVQQAACQQPVDPNNFV